MASLKCPKCGKVYQRAGAYYNKHIQSCTGKEPKKRASNSVKIPKKVNTYTKISNRLDLIEKRLLIIEGDLRILKLGQTEKKSKIQNENQLLEIINQKVQELSQKRLGIQKVLLSDLFDAINDDHNISRSDYSKYLIKLYNRNKIQLESGMSSDTFSINDSYGNVFKILRVLD
ncbi:MAG: hypothetical protein ACFFEY_20880 [Candidatus Thorarchaeota archaeon]